MYVARLGTAGATARPDFAGSPSRRSARCIIGSVTRAGPDFDRVARGAPHQCSAGQLSPDLPITALKDEIIRGIRNHQVLVIAGETGPARRPNCPRCALEAGLGIEAKISCTQPRRVAALFNFTAHRGGIERNLGPRGGCKIRFEGPLQRTDLHQANDRWHPARGMQGDPDLSEYNAIIIDEAHERSLNIDSYSSPQRTARAPARSETHHHFATIDTQAFSRHFGDAPIMRFPEHVSRRSSISAADRLRKSAGREFTWMPSRCAERIFTKRMGWIRADLHAGERDIAKQRSNSRDVAPARWK